MATHPATAHPATRSFPDLRAAPAPFDHNPSDWSQRVPIAVLALVGFFISVYMGLYQWGLIDSVWDPFFGEQTEKVLKSDVSHKISSWVGVPDAILGAVAYLGDALFSLAGSTRRWQYRPWMVVIFGIDVIPLGGVSAILVMMQAFVVGSWCFLCLVSAVISLILIGFAYDEVWASLVYLNRVRKRAETRGQFWSAVWGQPSEVAHEVAEGMVNERKGGKK
mgnify:CR=1 FL=1